MNGRDLPQLTEDTFSPDRTKPIAIEACLHCRRFEFPPEEYDQFCERYGRDVREWSSYEVFKNLRELRMITTNARKSAQGSPQAAEVHRRIDQLGGNSNSRWSIL